jgi:hypothetical protein
MLANGITLSYKKKSETGTTFTLLPGLKEVPELGNTKEKVENTALSDDVRQYEYGIGDPGDLEYQFRYMNAAEKEAYRSMAESAENNEVLSFQEKFPDGTTYAFDAQVDVRMGGGGVNGVIDWTLAIALQSKITRTDPA